MEIHIRHIECFWKPPLVLNLSVNKLFWPTACMKTRRAVCNSLLMCLKGLLGQLQCIIKVYNFSTWSPFRYLVAFWFYTWLARLSGNVSVNEVSGRKHNAVQVKFCFYSLILSEKRVIRLMLIWLLKKKSSSLKKIWDTRVTCAHRGRSHRCSLRFNWLLAHTELYSYQ